MSKNWQREDLKFQFINCEVSGINENVLKDVVCSDRYPGKYMKADV